MKQDLLKDSEQNGWFAFHSLFLPCILPYSESVEVDRENERSRGPEVEDRSFV